MYQILEVYRQKGQGSCELFETLEHRIRTHLKQVNIEELLALLRHYSSSDSVPLTKRQEMLGLLEVKTIQVSQFFNSNELMSVLFYFQKGQVLSPSLL